MAATPPTVDSSNLANNAFTNLAPLLTLFGDELTKQFLSTTIGWMDIVLLGIAPIGIPTVIVSAIRVGGNGFLKSIVGRARDSRDDEKKELLSSTSSNIREIWDGARVVRQTGEKITKFFVFDTNWTDETQSKIITPLENDHRYALKPRTIDTVRWWGLDWSGNKVSRLLKDSITPSLSLSNPKAIPSTRKTLGALCLGIIIQLTVISINALIDFKWHKLRAKRVVAPWAFWVWLAGTVAISFGVSMCAYVVVCKTRHLILRRSDENNNLQIFRVQTALDKEGIPAYFIRHNPINATLRWSQSDENQQPLLILIGAFCALGGFVCQNFGTRELHFSAGLLQFGATFILSGLRAYLRRHVGDPLEPKPVRLDGTLACSVSYNLFDRYLKPFSYFPIFILDEERLLLSSTQYPQRQISSDREEHNRRADVIIKSWGQLANLHDKDDVKELTELADSLVKAMDWLLKRVTGQDATSFLWFHKMCIGDPTDYGDAYTRYDRQALTAQVRFDSGSKEIQERIKAVLNFSNDLKINAKANKTNGALQIVGSIQVENKDEAETLGQYLQRRIRFWYPGECEDMPLDRVDGRSIALYELFGLEFSSLRPDMLTTANPHENTNTDYCDIVVGINTSEAYRTRQMTIQLFISFLNELAAQKKKELAAFLRPDNAFLKPDNAIDDIANELVELEICEDVYEARIPIFSVLWSHELVSLSEITKQDH